MIQEFFMRSRAAGLERCEAWLADRYCQLAPTHRDVLDVGCGDGSFWAKPHFEYWNRKGMFLRPRRWCGIEADPAKAKLASRVGLAVKSWDFNLRWCHGDHEFDVVMAAQSIEHAADPLHFLREARRVLRPGGTLLLASENLTSWLNTAAMILGRAPFSLQQVGGAYTGGLGPHDGETLDPLAEHRRVLSTDQAQELARRGGFSQARAWSIGLVLVPDWASQIVERWLPRRGHWLLMEAKR